MLPRRKDTRSWDGTKPGMRVRVLVRGYGLLMCLCTQKYISKLLGSSVMSMCMGDEALDVTNYCSNSCEILRAHCNNLSATGCCCKLKTTGEATY